MTSADLHPVLVVDFGAQYAQLIARRVREASVYSEIVPHTMPVAEMLAKEPAAIILSGGPSSVYEEGAPSIDPAIFAAGVPVLGICYGFQTMAHALGGTVGRTGTREYGHTEASPSPHRLQKPRSQLSNAASVASTACSGTPRLGTHSSARML